RAEDTIEYFAEFYGWTRLKHIETSPDKFLTRVHSMAWWKDKLLKAATEHNQLSNNNYAVMKNTAKKSFLASKRVLSKTSLSLSIRRPRCKTRKHCSLFFF